MWESNTEMMFIDVGAHEGQTLREVVNPRYSFNEIYAFEPMPNQYRSLKRWREGLPLTYKKRLHLMPLGLSDYTGHGSIYGANDSMEASVFPDKTDVDSSVVTDCRFLKVSEFFKHFVQKNDQAVMKLNVEGAEVPILNNLIDSGEIHKCLSIMIDFDCIKIPSQQHHKQELIDRMKAVGFNHFCLAEDVMVGVNHQDRIAHWLTGIGVSNV